MRNRLTAMLCLTLVYLLCICINANYALARTAGDDRRAASASSDNAANKDSGKTDSKEDSAGSPKSPAKKDEAPNVEDRLKALEDVIERQQREIQALREVVNKRQLEPVPAAETTANADSANASSPVASSQGQPPKTDAQADNQKRFDELYKKFGSIRFSGDIRFRAETFDNQGFDAATEPPGRYRLRIRARLALDGVLDKHFDWGLKVATGIFTDPITTNQTMTDAFERKPFALERAFIRFDSRGDKVGVQFIAGKFDPTFRRTQMVWDDDINVEGASEAVYFKTKTPLRQIKFVAFQLPFNEVSAGKDGVLFGGQAQTDWQFTPKVSGNFNVGYYSWNHVDQIVGILGAATTQVNGGIQNGAAVTGGQNGALGTTNRIVRNAAGQPIGFLASFNLLDVLGNVTWQASGRFPVTFTFDYVHNMSSRIRNEKNGYWPGISVGQSKEKGDWLFGYYYTRIEQDAVLVPFNFSDILGSNSRAHMPTVAYTIANNVIVQWTGLFSQRANPVTTTGINRYLSRMQFDVIYKF